MSSHASSSVDLSPVFDRRAPVVRAGVSSPPLAPRLAWVLAAFTLFLVLGLWSWVGYQIRREGQEAISQAQTHLAHLTRAVADRTARTIEGADQVLRFLRRDYLAQGAQLELDRYLEQSTSMAPEWQLALIGPSGRVADASRAFGKADVREDEHFRVHAAGFKDRLFISRPLSRAPSAPPTLQLTRRIDRADGSFGGVVALSLPLHHFTPLDQEPDSRTRASVSLLGYDGIPRMRAAGERSEGGPQAAPEALLDAARRRKAGTLVVRDPGDGLEWIWAFRALDPYELVVFAGVRTDEVRREPLLRRLAYLGLASLTTLTLLAFMVLLLRTLRRQEELLRRLRDSERSAKAASRMKTRFLASVSHELRTPLNGILGYAELIRDTSRDADSREYGAVVHQSAQHLHGLVNTLLDLARIESGRMSLQLQPVSPSEVIAEVMRLHAVVAESRGLTLAASCSPEAPALIHSDRGKLVQVLNNLVSNAIKFTERGDVVLSLEPAPEGVRITVRDSGIGISPARLETLFVRFHSTMSDFLHPAQGAGLGLPLSRELVELLGGALGIESAEGQGTRIVVRLPLRAPVVQEVP